VQTKTNINQLVYNAIQLVTRCPPTPHNKTLEDRRIFVVPQKSLHPQKRNEQFIRTSKNLDLPIKREAINAIHNGDHAHFCIEGGQLGNAN
jgi:hypothetical protein